MSKKNNKKNSARKNYKIESYLMQTPLTLEVCFKAKEDTAIVVSIAQ